MTRARAVRIFPSGPRVLTAPIHWKTGSETILLRSKNTLDFSPWTPQEEQEKTLWLV